MAVLLELELAGRIETLPGNRVALLAGRRLPRIPHRSQCQTSSSSNPPPRPRPSTAISVAATPCWPASATCATCRRRMASCARTQDFAMDWESDARGDKQVGAIAKALKGAQARCISPPTRIARARRFPGMCKAMLADKNALKGVDVQPHQLQRDHPQRRPLRHRPSARSRSAADRGLSGPPRAGLSGGLHAVAGAVAQAARQPQRRPRAVGRAAPDLRPRGRDRGRSGRANTGRSRRCSLTPAGAPFTARLTHLNGKRLDQFDLNNETLALARQGARWKPGRFTVGSVETQAGQAQPAAAVHHLDAAAGGVAQARLRRAADDAAGAAAV